MSVSLVYCGNDPRAGVGFQSDNGCYARTPLGNLQCCGFTWCSESCQNRHVFSSEHSNTTAGATHARFGTNAGNRVSFSRI